MTKSAGGGMILAEEPLNPEAGSGAFLLWTRFNLSNIRYEMTQRKPKMLTLKRCYMPEGFNSTLETIIDAIKERFPNHEDRIFKPELFKSHVIGEIAKRSNPDKGVFVSVLCQNSGATGLINLGKSKETAEIEEYRAPENTAWGDNQILLYVVGNHIVCCNAGPRDGFLGTLLLDFAKKAEAVNDDCNFTIADVPNTAELERINRVGVKEVDLSLTSYLSTFENFKGVSESRIKPVLERVLGTVDSTSHLKKRASAKGRLRLTRGGSLKKEEISKDDWLTDIGATIIEQELEDYRLILEDGNVIASSRLKIMKSVRLREYGNTFSLDEARVQATNFYEELETNGSLAW